MAKLLLQDVCVSEGVSIRVWTGCKGVYCRGVGLACCCHLHCYPKYFGTKNHRMVWVGKDLKTHPVSTPHCPHSEEFLSIFGSKSPYVCFLYPKCRYIPWFGGNTTKIQRMAQENPVQLCEMVAGM